MSSEKKINSIPVKLSLRTDNLSNWISCNPILQYGEVAVTIVDDNTPLLKIGNGISSYTELKYLNE